MKLDVNDPKWTAYAFGELDAEERAAVEAELRLNPTARHLVTELQRTGELLKGALAKESVARLTPAQQAALAASVSDQQLAVCSAAVSPLSPRRQVRTRRRMVAVLGAIAASGLFVALLLPAMRPALHSGRISKTDKKAESKEDQFASASNRSTRGAAADRRDGDRAETAVDSPRESEQMPQDASRRTSEIRPAAPVNLPQDNFSKYAVHKPYYEAESSRSLSAGLELDSGTAVGDGYGSRSSAPNAKSDSLRVVTLRGTLDPNTLREKLSQLVPANESKHADGIVRELQDLDGKLEGGGEPAAEQRFRESREFGGERAENEAYELPPENAFEPVAANPLSTFSIDVDTASYANIRRFLTQNNQLPPPAAVRIEEMLNYFRYDYPQPEGDVPFSVTTEVATCPWNADHRLVRVGLKGKEIAREKRPVSNLVFLLDVSGSMQPANKLPLVREAMKLLVRELSENDRVAIVVYAGASGQVLDSTTGDQKDTIMAAIDNLQAGGSTNGAGGIQQAYDVAMQHFIKGGTNRVILATDGDFNVGITDRDQLVKLIDDKAKSGVFLTTVGFGMGNLKDATLEQLADKGNGNYAYVDTLAEARKVFVEEMAGTLITIAKDVKVQIEFNPAEVASYRLIGYENRRLAAEDFNDDKMDAGEIGAGHTVTALYELMPVGQSNGGANPGLPAGAAANTGVDPLRYQKPAAAKVELTDTANSGELFTLKLRYKQPDGDTSKLIEHPVKDSGKAYREASGDFKFAASVAAFGMTLRHSRHRGSITLDGIKELAQEGRSFDPSGYRSEFLTLIEKAQALGAK
jgi:Ca-activated chloride channel family protein